MALTKITKKNFYHGIGTNNYNDYQFVYSGMYNKGLDEILAAIDDSVANLTLANISDFPTLTGQAGKVLACNGTEDGVEFITPAGGGGISTASVNLSAAQIVDLQNNRVEIVPSPGAGKVILPVAAIIDYTFVSTFYHPLSGTLTIESESINAGLLYTSALAAAEADFISAFIDSEDKILEAGAIYIGCNGDIFGGDGTAKVTVLYQEITL